MSGALIEVIDLHHVGKPRAVLPTIVLAVHAVADTEDLFSEFIRIGGDQLEIIPIGSNQINLLHYL